MRTELDSCTLCGGTTRQLKAHRSRLSFGARLPAALAFPFTPAGLLALFVLAAIPASLSGALWPLPFFAKTLGFGFWVLTFWSMMFHIIRLTARGETDISIPDVTEVSTDVVLPAIRGFIASSFVWAPAALYVAKRYGADGFFHAGQLVRDPVFWLVAVAGITYSPMAVLVGATGGGLVRILNPVVIVAYIQRIPRSYATAVAALAGLFGLRLLLGGVALLIMKIPVPFLSHWVAEVIELYPAFVMARVVGLLLYLHGDALDYGMADDYFEPVIATEPRGSLTLTGSARRDIDNLRPAPPEPTVAATGIAATLEEVKRSVDGNDVDRAVEIYSGAPQFAPHQLPSSYHFAVGQGAATRGNYPLAVRALTAASETDPSDPIAPRAFVVLARVYGERMNDARKANAIYQFVIERYPGTSAAQFALTRMSPVKA
ncbi:MAG: tetratricopeptide repeat protein [Myxococcaceae bacterium]